MSSGPKRPSRRLAGLAGPPPTGVTAADSPVEAAPEPVPAPARPRARARGSTPPPAPATVDAPLPAPAPAPASTPTPAPEPAPIPGYARQRAVETAARAYAAARRRLAEREQVLLAAARVATEQEVMAGLVGAGLDPVEEAPEEIARVIRERYQ